MPNEWAATRRFLIAITLPRVGGQRSFSRSHGGFVLGSITLLIALMTASAAERQPEERKRSNFSTRFAGEYRYQTSSDLKAGTNFEVERFVSQASLAYRPSPRRSLSLSLSYSRDAYDIAVPNAAGGFNPWGEIDTVGLSLPIIWGLADRWTLLGIPMIRGTAESGADWGDAITGGGIVGFSYRVSDSLSIGPGLGLLTQLEDRVNPFPVLVVDWTFADRGTLATGRGLGASQGPGLLLSSAASETWTLLLGGRYERFRFRLRENGAVPDGVGEDRGLPLSLGARYRWNRVATLTCFAGVNAAGRILVEDASGSDLFSSNYDPAPFFGAMASFRF